MIRQVSILCPQCGSVYRRVDNCNVCGTSAPVPSDLGPLPDGNHPSFTREGKVSRGQLWDKTQHKFKWR